MTTSDLSQDGTTPAPLPAPDWPPPDPATPLPAEVKATLAFVRRLPSQRTIDSLAKLDPTPYGELQEQMPSRVLAFRVLLRDYPRHDFGSLWLHAYDVEVELEEDVDPSSPLAQTLWPPSAPPTA